MPLTESDLDHILEHTKGLWDYIADSKLFITGGTGFFGKWLLESFAWANKQLDLNAKMLVLSRSPESFKTQNSHLAKPCFDFIKGDIRDFELPEGSFDYIIHAAADVNTKLFTECPQQVTKTIIEGTQRVLEFAKKCGTKRFLYISSGAVYGKQPSDITHVPEDYWSPEDTTELDCSYGRGKRISERLCCDYFNDYGLETVIARCFAFVGPYLNLDIHYAIGNFIRDGLNDNVINIKGDRTPYRSYLYAADLAIWLWTLLFDGKPGRAYNVGSDQQINIADLAGRVSNCFEKPCGVNITKKPVKGQAPQRYVPSIQRAREELGLERYVELDDAIKRTIDFYQPDTRPI